MDATLVALVEKVLNSRADKGFWLNKAVQEAVAWGQSKARELKIQWRPATRAAVAAKAREVYAAKGLNDRGQKS